MDKIRVCDLAKKYGITSKELLAFYNDNNVEVKAAQSSVDENAVKMADAHFAKTETKTTETVKAVEEKKEETVKAPASEPVENAAPKKKKNIIFVSNPQNSKMPGDRRPASGSQPRQGQGNNNNRQGQGNNRPVQASNNTYRPLIKPLTPASPTPEVNMVKPGYRTSGEKVQPVKEEKPVQNTAMQQNGDRKPAMQDRGQRPERGERTGNNRAACNQDSTR